MIFKSKRRRYNSVKNGRNNNTGDYDLCTAIYITCKGDFLWKK